MENTSFACSICSEPLTNSPDICSTVCGHIFHLKCMQQWLQRANRCPYCNHEYPEPHRIFLDLEGMASGRTSSTDTDECSVIIKGVSRKSLEEIPSADIVIQLAETMGVPMTESDIALVYRQRDSLQVHFRTQAKRNSILRNKYRLKRNPNTTSIVVHEVLSPEVKELFAYSHKLKECGFDVIFVRNKCIFAQQHRNSEPIHIRSKDQVDALCTQVKRESEECTIL